MTWEFLLCKAILFSFQLYAPSVGMNEWQSLYNLLVDAARRIMEA